MRPGWSQTSSRPSARSTAERHECRRSNESSADWKSTGWLTGTAEWFLVQTSETKTDLSKMTERKRKRMFDETKDLFNLHFWC